MQKYLITSREFYTDTPAVFRNIVHEQFAKHAPTHALYRDKSNPSYDIQAEHFVEVCKQFETIKSFIHQDIDLAFKLGATGVHLTSQQFGKIEYAKSEGLEVIISTHTHEEVLIAQDLDADAVTYSPVFTSPGKGKPKGILDLEKIIDKSDIKIFALGGVIDEDHIKQLYRSKVYGFASIRYFY